MSRTVEISCEVRHLHRKAVLIYDGDVECWIPLDYVKTEDELETGKIVVIEIPEWIANQKGLI